MKKTSGVSLAELLISLGLVSAILLTLSATWLYTVQTSAQINQIRLAEQVLNNISTELSLNQNAWDSSILNDWQHQASQALLNTHLNINTNHLQITWPSQNPLNINCEVKKEKTNCLGLTF